MKVWVCMACGKRSKDRYGKEAINKGWDVSCMINAQRFNSNELVLNEEGRVIKIVNTDVLQLGIQQTED